MAKAKRPFDPATLPQYTLLQDEEIRRRRELLTGVSEEDAEPTDPFEVRTEAFTGPLDLLIYLLREGEIEVDQLPILPVVEQYLSYLLTLNQELLDVNLAAESVSIIAQILDMKLKLKGLLNTEEDPEEPDPETGLPRLDLIAELMELQRLKRMTLKLAERFEEWQYRPGRPEDAAPVAPSVDGETLIIPPAQIVAAFKAIVEQVNAHVHEATIPREEVTLEEQILYVMAMAEREAMCAFHRLFVEDIGHKEKIVTTFIAVLELTRQGKIVISQPELQGVIYFETADRYRERLGLAAPTAETERALSAPGGATPADGAAPADGSAPAEGAPPVKKSPFGKGGEDGAAGATDLSDLFSGGEEDLDEEGQNMRQRIDAAIKIYHRVNAALDAYQQDGVILSATEAAARAGVDHVAVDKLKGERWWQKKKADLAIGDQVALGEQLAAELAAVEGALAAENAPAGAAGNLSADPLSTDPAPSGALAEPIGAPGELAASVKILPPAKPPANVIAIQLKKDPPTQP